ncbi:MAG TPA: hypothetical protein VKY70_16930 [Pseudomonas sp.]|jgi:hypothetical protein|nr:hypothetical protein [Pseudomonas sp.]
MRPVPLHSPWRDRRHRLYALLIWMLVGLLLTRPQTTTGILIAVTLIPALALLAFALHRWWIRHFARSNLMHAVYIGLLMLAVGGVLEAVELLHPYVGGHFS